MSEEKRKGVQGAAVIVGSGVTGAAEEVQFPVALHKPVESEAVDEPTQRRRGRAAAPATARALIVDQEGAQQSEANESGGSLMLTRNKMSTTVMELRSPSETIVLLAPEVELQKPGLSQPIPLKQITPIDTEITKSEKSGAVTQRESLVESIVELPPKKRHSEWSDEEEAGVLPRSQSRASRASRASRVSRAMWHLFCCGRPVNASSEEKISGRDGFSV